MRIPIIKSLVAGLLLILAFLRGPVGILSNSEWLVEKLATLGSFLQTDAGEVFFNAVVLVLAFGLILYGLFRPNVRTYIPQWMIPAPKLTHDMFVQRSSEVNERFEAVEIHFALVAQDPSRLLGDLAFEYKSVNFEKDLLQPVLYFRFIVQNRSQFHWLKPTGITTGEINIDLHPLVGVPTVITMDPDGEISPGGYCFLNIGIAVNDRLYTHLTESAENGSPLSVEFRGLSLEIAGRNDQYVQQVLGSISPAGMTTVLLPNGLPW